MTAAWVVPALDELEDRPACLGLELTFDPSRGCTVEANMFFLTSLGATGTLQKPDIAKEQREVPAGRGHRLLRYHTGRASRPSPRSPGAGVQLLRERGRSDAEHYEQVLAGNPAAEASINKLLSEIRARKGWSQHVVATLAPPTKLDIRLGGQRLLPFGLQALIGSNSEPRSTIVAVRWEPFLQ